MITVIRWNPTLAWYLTWRSNIARGDLYSVKCAAGENITFLYLKMHSVFNPCFCYRRFKFLKTFTDHYKADHDQEFFRCNFCARPFRSDKSLFRHKITEHDFGEAKHACKVCGKLFKDQRHAKRHEIYHRSESERRQHQCKHCSKKFMSV